MMNFLTLLAGFPVYFRDISSELAAIAIGLAGTIWTLYVFWKKPKQLGQNLAAGIILVASLAVMALGVFIIYSMVLGRVFIWEW